MQKAKVVKVVGLVVTLAAVAGAALGYGDVVDAVKSELQSVICEAQ